MKTTWQWEYRKRLRAPKSPGAVATMMPWALKNLSTVRTAALEVEAARRRARAYLKEHCASLDAVALRQYKAAACAPECNAEAILHVVDASAD